MQNPNRRKFLAGSASAVLTLYFGQARLAQAQVYNLGAFWRKSTVKVVAIQVSQVISKAAVLDVSYNIQTSQALTKVALLDVSYNIQTTQALAKVALLNTSYLIDSSQLVAKVAVRDAEFNIQTSSLVVKVAVRA